MQSENPNSSKQEVEAPEGVERAAAHRAFQPAVDIVEAADAVYLVADVPGVNETAAEVMLEKNVLTIRGRVEPPSFPGYSPAYMEYEVGDHERSFTISSEIDRDAIEATVKEGVLSVRLPKSQRATKQKIFVKAG